MLSATEIRWLKNTTLSFRPNLAIGSRIFAFILNFIISQSSPICKSSLTWNRKKNFPTSRCLSITLLLMLSMTTPSKVGCLNRKFSYSTFRYAGIIRYVVALTKREEFLVMVDTLTGGVWAATLRLSWNKRSSVGLWLNEHLVAALLLILVVHFEHIHLAFVLIALRHVWAHRPWIWRLTRLVARLYRYVLSP